jgi:superoxide reductase
MNRRAFIKGTLLTVAAVSSGEALAGEYKHESKKELNRLTSRDNPSVLEQKHVPGIEAPDTVQSGVWFDVRINVGFMKEHPSTPGHWITKIKLLIDGSEAAESEFKKGGITSSYAVFRIKLDTNAKLEAIEHCNLHGTWISDPVDIKVTH